ncbi:MAG: nuclear transport factor 2 family protein [Bryobacteraceae bacterium]
MITTEFAKYFAEEWIAAWNSHDLERIFSHYTEDFEMSSPYIAERMGEPSGTLKGKAAIRPYWTAGLTWPPPLQFELQQVYTGADSITIVYRRVDGPLVAEVLFFNSEGKAVKGVAHYCK